MTLRPLYFRYVTTTTLVAQTIIIKTQESAVLSALYHCEIYSVDLNAQMTIN
jgi:hypothetical protein